MKKGLVILVALVIILIVGGGVTSQLASLPMIQQTDSPAASVFEATPEQANLFFLMVGFILFNVVGAGLTLLAVFWFGDRAVRSARAMPNREDASDKDAIQAT